MGHDDNIKDSWMLLRNSHTNALEELYNGHYLGMINFGIKLTGDREFANDCIVQLLIELWDKRQQLPHVENVRAYLLTCLKHKIIAEVKAQQTRNESHHSLLTIQDNEEMSYEDNLIRLQSDKAMKKKLSQALDKLTLRQKELLKLKFYDKLDYDEIALQSGISKRTAYNIIYDALKILKTEFYTNNENGSLLTDAILLTLLISLLAQ
jgi:RNA polymerase sigma factor (sigma-70 family)